MRRYPYIRCTGDKDRICLLCDAPYVAKNPVEVNTFCPTCFTPVRKYELRHLYKSLWRAKKANVPATLTIKQWLGILDRFNWKCAYCKKPYQVIEHVVSISQSGGTTELNCVPACLTCNRHKDNVNGNTISSATIEHVQEQLKQLAMKAS